MDALVGMFSGAVASLALSFFTGGRREHRKPLVAASAIVPISGIVSNSLDSAVGSALTLGGTNATGVSIGAAATTTSVLGALSVGTTSTLNGAVSITPTSNQLKLGAVAHQVTISSTAPAAAAQTYTLYDAGQSCNIALGIDNSSALTASTTLTAAQSGSNFSCVQNGTAEVVATLPAAAVGLKFRFILTTAAANHFTILSAGAAGTMKGALMSSNGAAAVNVSTSGVNLASAVRARMIGGTAIVGDFIVVECVDGTNWIAHGQSGATNGNIFVI